MKTQRTPTSEADLARINEMFEKLQHSLLSLYDRWQDEKEYENIDDYGEAVAKWLPEGFTFCKMQKRPFGFTFKIGTSAEYLMTCNSRQVEWKRTA